MSCSGTGSLGNCWNGSRSKRKRVRRQPEMAMRKLPGGINGYVRGRAAELARPETRAVAEPLAEWARRRIRLDGRPFTFDGHEYLRPIYNDTAPHVVLCKAAQIGGTTWGILRYIHACAMGLNVGYYFPTKT